MRNVIFIITLILPLLTFGRDNRSIFDDPKEYKHLHSNYFPIEVNENLYMTDYSTILYMMHIEYGLEFGNVGMDSIITFHRLNHIPFYCKQSPEKYGLLLVKNPYRIYEIVEILNNCVRDTGEIEKNPFDVSNNYGQIIYSLFVNHIAVQTDCMTGNLFVPYIESVKNNLDTYKYSDNKLVPKETDEISKEEFEYYPLLINGVMYMTKQEYTKVFFENEHDKLIPIYYNAMSKFFSSFKVSLYSKKAPENYGLVRVDRYDDIIEEFENNMEAAIEKYDKLLLVPGEVDKLKKTGKFGIVLYCLYSYSVKII